MSKWNHLICESCWNKRHPEREPVRIKEEFRDEKAEPCCFCGKGCQSGIYVRENPVGTPCMGEGEVHDD